MYNVSIDNLWISCGKGALPSPWGRSWAKDGCSRSVRSAIFLKEKTKWRTKIYTPLIRVFQVSKVIQLLSNFRYKSNVWPFLSSFEQPFCEISGHVLGNLEQLVASPKAKRTWPLIQSGKTCYAAICASPRARTIALLAGSGHNASCNGLQWLETAPNCNEVREDVARLIYLYLVKHEIFRHNKSPPACGEALLLIIFSGLLINMQYVKSVCGKKLIPHETIHQLSIS